MIYTVNKFRHYLLVNEFVIFADHKALLYLVNNHVQQDGLCYVL